MRDLAKTYLKYGVPSNFAMKYEGLKLSATEFRALSLTKLEEIYGVLDSEAKIVKEYLTRQPIDFAVIQELLENNNFTCCCCKGVKSDGYVIHHIVKYEISQDNNYSNLAVLCPNDHDLAHRGTGLTSGITAEQIRLAKINWEQTVKVHRLVAASPIELNKFYLSIPRYCEMQNEIDELKRGIKEKEIAANLRTSLIASESESNRLRLSLLEQEKASLEAQIQTLIQKLSKFNPEESSALHTASIAKFLAGDISGALEVLSEQELDAQMTKLMDAQKAVVKGLLQNVDDRIFRSTLLLLTGEVKEACELAGRTLKKTEELSDTNPELLFRLVRCYEEVGTVYFNANLIDAAESVFQAGLALAWDLQEQGDSSVVPSIPDFLHNLGTVYYAREEFDAAKDYLENSAEWYSGLRPVFENHPEITVNPMDQMLVKNLTNLATTYKALGLNEMAVAAFERLERISHNESIVEGSNPESRARYLASKANLLLSSGDAVNASKLLEELIPLLERLSGTYPSMYAKEFANTCLEMCAAQSLIDAESPKMAQYCDRAEKAARKLVVVDPSGDRSPLAYALMYSSLQMLKTNNKDEACIATVKEANAIVESLNPEEGDSQLREGVKMLLNAINL